MIRHSDSTAFRMAHVDAPSRSCQDLNSTPRAVPRKAPAPLRFSIRIFLLLLILITVGAHRSFATDTDQVTWARDGTRASIEGNTLLIQREHQKTSSLVDIGRLEADTVDGDQGLALAIAPGGDYVAYLGDQTLEILDLQKQPPTRRSVALNDVTRVERSIGWPERCAQPLLLADSREKVALERSINSVMVTIREVNSIGRASRLEISGENAYFAVTRFKQGYSTELWRYRCSSTGKPIEITRLPDAMQAPKVLATPQGAYVIDQLEPFKLGKPSPVLHVSASEGSMVRASYPCPDGYGPMYLSLVEQSTKVRVGCWTGGNASNSSVEVEM